MQNLPSDVAAAAVEINRQRKVDAPARVSAPEFSLVAGQYPAEAAFHTGCFALLPYGLQKNLLTETRNIHKSYTMRIFQHFTLGSKRFAETYKLPAEFETKPFLMARVSIRTFPVSISSARSFLNCERRSFRRSD